MTHLKIVSWNINSVRLRIESVAQFVREASPDILCLQEIKCLPDEFPEKAFRDMGLPHVLVNGQKGYHGVAIASRHPLRRLPDPPLCPRDEARTLAADIGDGITLHNLYVPAGGDIPDPEANDKFGHKLDFIARMHDLYAGWQQDRPLVLLGDLNIAPFEHDVWSHKQLLDVVSHTPVETNGLNDVKAAGEFADLARIFVPESEKLFTWWSYRSADWSKNNRGRRLDHIWAAGPAIAAARSAEAFGVHVRCRSWEKPSDHVPVEAGFDF